jgi:enoyl-CoA hydratase/carnithine racemase
MADWDPFAMDGAADPVNSAATKVPDTGGTTQPCGAEDLKHVEEALWGMLSGTEPWKQAPKPYPDLSWYTPTCSFEDWRHQEVTIEKGQQVLYVNINRPDNGNMINDKVLLALLDATMGLQLRKTEFRMAVFSAVGEKMFCAGKDPSSDGMSGFTKSPPPAVKQVWSNFLQKAKNGGAFPDGNEDMGRILRAKFWHTFSSLPQFTVALVNGSVMGEGMALVAACDTVVSVSNAFFNISDVQNGSINPLVVPYIEKKIGPAFTKYMLCASANLSAEKAWFYGLVTKVVESVEEAHKEIGGLATVLTACGPRSVEAAKNLVIGVAGQQINEGIMFFTAQQLAMVTISQEATDGMVCVQARKPKPWEEEPNNIKPLH